MDKKSLFLFLLVIFSLKFFDAVIANTGILKNLCFGYMFLAILMSLPYFFKYKGGFVLPVQIICVAIVISLFMALYTWHQGFEYAPTTIPYMGWFVFFYLLNANIPIKTIEKIVMFYGCLYIILFLFQFTHTGVVYFGMAGEFKQDRGVIRVNFPGGGVFFLACFIAVNKVTSTVGKYKYYWLFFALTGIVIIVLQVTRQEIFILLIIYLIHFLKNVKLMYKIATIALFCVAGYVFVNSGTSISKGLADQQKEDASYGKDYIRIQSAEYFLTQFNTNTLSSVFGNGFANDTSNYGKALIALADQYGYFLTDVGIVEVYITFGVFAILGYLLILIKSIIIPIPTDYYYLKYYLWMIMATSFTSDHLVSYYFLTTTALVLYCYQRLYEQNKLNELISLNQTILTNLCR